MRSEKLSYLNVPTIPSEFLAQMVGHLVFSHRLSAEATTMWHALQQKRKISIAEYQQLFKLLSNEMQDEMIGFMPRSVPNGSFEALCQMLSHCPDVASAITHYNQFYSLFLPGRQSLLDLTKLEASGDLALYPVNVSGDPPMFQHTVVLGLLKICTWLTGKRVIPARLDFNFDAMPFNHEFNYIFGTVPRYSAPATRLSLSTEVVHCRIAPSSKKLPRMDSYVEYLLYWSDSDDVARNVYAEIANRLAFGDFDVISIAASMHMSKHTLARRLAEKKTSYTQILERVRRDIALYSLLDTPDSVEHIAERLGFKEVGSFSRAFKLWMGVTPSEYRQLDKKTKN